MGAVTDERNGFWIRLLMAMLPIIVIGFVALVALRTDVRHLQEDLQTKANRETVEAQNRAVLQAIEDLRGELREFRQAMTRR